MADDDLDCFHMDDYDDIHTCRSNRGGGGVALYINIYYYSQNRYHSCLKVTVLKLFVLEL